jgi:hypothetical protein
MSELTPDVKAALHTKIDDSDIEGIYEALKIILQDKQHEENPDIYTVEFTRAQGNYLRSRAAAVNMDVETLLRWAIDGMMKAEKMTSEERMIIDKINKQHARMKCR